MQVNLIKSILFVFFININSFATSFYDFQMNHGDKGIIDFREFKGKVILLTNIATRCGFTEQLDDLEKLNLRYQDKNFVVLGIPSNNFLSQTPEDNKEVVQFCKLKYKTNFPITEKVNVIGDDKHAVIKWIQEQNSFSSPILWNFEKFLIDRNGKVVTRFRSITKPLDSEIIKAIENELAK